MAGVVVVGAGIVGSSIALVYVAVMHSAVPLGPTVGRLVAEELTGGGPALELARCRPAVEPM